MDEHDMEKVLEFLKRDLVVDVIYDCKSEVIGPGSFRFKAEIDFNGVMVVQNYLRRSGREEWARQGVTLGGTGKEVGDRHPKVGDSALLGARVTILGNILVGDGAMIVVGSLVLKEVPSHRSSGSIKGTCTALRDGHSVTLIFSADAMFTVAGV